MLTLHPVLGETLFPGHPLLNQVKFAGIHVPPPLQSVDQVGIHIGILPIVGQIIVRKSLMPGHTLLGSPLELLLALPLQPVVISFGIPGKSILTRQDQQHNQVKFFHNLTFDRIISRMLKIMPGNRGIRFRALRYQSMNLTSEILVIPRTPR